MGTFFDGDRLTFSNETLIKSICWSASNSLSVNTAKMVQSIPPENKIPIRACSQCVSLHRIHWRQRGGVANIRSAIEFSNRISISSQVACTGLMLNSCWKISSADFFRESFKMLSKLYDGKRSAHGCSLISHGHAIIDLIAIGFSSKIFNSSNCSKWTALIGCHGCNVISSAIKSMQNTPSGGSSMHLVYWCFDAAKTLDRIVSPWHVFANNNDCRPKASRTKYNFCANWFK